MAKRRYSIDIRGRCKEWSFPIWAEPKDAQEWRLDGLTVTEVLDVVPQWVVNIGLVGLWLWIADTLSG